MELGERVAQVCKKLLQGVRGELLHRRLGCEWQFRGRVAESAHLSGAVAVGGRSFLGYRKSIESWITECVELQVDFLVSVIPSVFEKNNGNESTIR